MSASRFLHAVKVLVFWMWMICLLPVGAAASFDSQVTMNKQYYPCESTIAVELFDLDLEGTGTQIVQFIAVPSELTPEPAVLTELPSLPGRFHGVMQLTPGVVLADGELQAVDGSLIVAYFEDIEGADGNPHVIQATAFTDCRVPINTSNIVTTLGGVNATITVTTNEPTTMTFQAGLSCSGPHNITQNDSVFGTNHVFNLTGLASDTDYYYFLFSRDTAGNAFFDNAGGSCFNFHTLNEYPVNLPYTLVDGLGFTWDIGKGGAIADGTQNVFDSGAEHISFGTYNTGTASNSGRTVLIGPRIAETIEARRIVYVPSDDGFIRYLEEIRNTGPTPSVYSFELFSNHRSVTRVATSSGNTALDSSDYWVMHDDEDLTGLPAVVQIVRGIGSAETTIAGFQDGGTDRYTTLLSATVPANSTVYFMHYMVQRSNRADAIAAAESIARLDGHAADHLTQDQTDSILNFNFDTLQVTPYDVGSATFEQGEATALGYSRTFTLTNEGGVSLDWTASSSVYLTPLVTSGTIPVGGSADVQVTLSAAADGLPFSTQSVPASISFVNTGTGVIHTRGIGLNVLQQPPKIAIDTAALSYHLRPGNTEDQVVQITNTGPTGARDLQVRLNCGAGIPDTQDSVAVSTSASNASLTIGYLTGTIYRIDKTVVLKEFFLNLRTDVPTTMEFRVYESTSEDGNYVPVYIKDHSLSPSGSLALVSSGDVNLTMYQGRYYALCIRELTGDVIYGFGDISSTANSFGANTRGCNSLAADFNNVDFTSEPEKHQVVVVQDPWLSVSSPSLVVPVGNQVPVTVTADATNLPDGTILSGLFTLSNNSAENPSPSIPADITVRELISFTHTPLPDTNDSVSSYPVCVDVIAEAGLNADSVELLYGLNANTFTVIPMSQVGENTYCAAIPPQPLGSNIHYYFRAKDLLNRTEVYPKGAPANLLIFRVGFPQLSFQVNQALSASLQSDSTKTIPNAITVRNVGFGNLNWSVQEIETTAGGARTPRAVLEEVVRRYNSQTSVMTLDVSTTRANGVDVLVLYSDEQAASDNVRNHLINSGRFQSVSTFNGSAAIPLLADLNLYEAVLCFSGDPWLDSNAMGDVLADYVDAGGGLVLAMFTDTATDNTINLRGRFSASNYYCIQSRGGHSTGRRFLGTIHQAGHPIMRNVDAFDGGTTSYRPTTNTLVAGSTRIADWSDGKPLVVTREIGSGRRVDLGMYPASQGYLSDLWVETTDGRTLLANSLQWAAGDAAWMELNQYRGVLSTNTSTTIDVTFDAQAVSEGFSGTGYLTIEAQAPNEPGQVNFNMSVTDDHSLSRIDFNFENDTQNWTFGSFAPTFTAPVGDHFDGTLRTRGTDDVSNFSIWESPKIQIVGPDQEPAPGSLPILGETGPDTLYRLRGYVRTDVANRQDAPQFRLRLSSADFQQNDLMICESTGTGDYSPGTNPTEYNHYFTPSEGRLNYLLDLDYINMSTIDADTGSIELDLLTLEALDTNLLEPLRDDYFARFFNGATNGWVTHDAAPFLGVPEVFEAAPFGLLIRGRNVPTPDLPLFTFGYWSTPSEGILTLEAGRLYKITFEVSTSAPEGREPYIPGFRVRANTNTFQASSYEEIGSIGDVTQVPEFGHTEKYIIYLYSNEAIAGDRLLLSFDYFHTPIAGDDETIAIVLHEVLVQSRPMN